MRTKQKLVAAFSLILLLFTFSPSYALGDTLLTQFGGSPTLVASGHSVETVITLGTDAHIAGTVRDVVLVISGNIYLEPTAHVDLVVDLGGHVYNSSLTSARTGIFELYPSQKFLNDMVIGGVLIFGIWFAHITISLIGILLLTGLGYFLHNRFKRASDLISASTPRLFGIGVATGLLCTAIIVLLSITIIGIPLAALILFFCLIAMLIGIIPLIDHLGKKILSPKILGYPPLTVQLIQSLLFVALANVPLLGFFFVAISALTGLGVVATTIWAFKKRKTMIKHL